MTDENLDSLRPCGCGVDGCTDIPELSEEELSKARPLKPITHPASEEEMKHYDTD